MKKYRKKPVVVEAVQLTRENVLEVLDWMNHEDTNRLTQLFDTGLTISTLEGNMKANYGDWIIKGVNGEFYPCKPDIFEKTYEPIESPAIKKQPEPKQSGYINVHDEVAEDIRLRKKLGKQKYGVELHPFNGRNPLVDAYQEVLDLAVYLRQAIYEEEMRWERLELLNLLLEVTRTACEVEKGKLDSMGNSAYADAIEVLIDENLLEFVEEISPDRVIAKVRDE